MPWSAIGRLQVPGVSRCTAVMIDPHWAVTAAHCLGAKVLGHVAPPSAVHLLLGYSDGAFVRHVQPDAIHVDPVALPDPALHRGRDLTLLHFSVPIADVLPLDAAPLPAGTTLALGGYGQDRSERLAVDPACTAVGTLSDADGRPVLVHGCTGTRGTSGGAMLTHTKGIWRLAGVQVAGRTDGAGGEAVPASSIAALLQAVR